MKPIILILTLFVFFNAKADKMQAICYWEVKSWNETKPTSFNMSKIFTVELNPNKEEIDHMTNNLIFLYKDYSMYKTVGRKKYEENLDNLMVMLNMPNCLVYPKEIEEEIIIPLIEDKSAKVESTAKKKSVRYDWPKCPGVIDLNSSYNYLGMNLKTQCY